MNNIFSIFIYILLIIILCVMLIRSITNYKNNKKIRAKKNLSFKDLLYRSNFNINKELTDSNWSIYVDNLQKKWCIYNSDTGFNKIFSFNDLIDYEIKEDNDSIIKGRSGSVVAGGLLFGGLGALAGASRSKKVKQTCSRLVINIVVNDIDNPNIQIFLISSETQKDSITYKEKTDKANEFNGILKYIISNSKETNSSSEKDNELEKLKKYKKLLDDGVITQEEFDKKKKDLLNL